MFVATAVSQSMRACPLLQNEPKTIGPTDGSRTIMQLPDFFTGGIDQGFGEIDFSSSETTEEVSFFLCGQLKGIKCDCVPRFIRESSMVGTQHQVVEFAEKHFCRLYEAQRKQIWFPFQHDHWKYVAGMYMAKERPAVRLIPLPLRIESTCVLDGHHRVVILRS